MTDIQGVLAGWEEARTNLGRKGSVLTIELRTAGQKVADALRECEGWRVAAFEETDHLREELAACLERETQLREALDLCNARDLRLNGCACDPAQDCYLHAKIVAPLSSSVGVGAVATEDDKA